MDTLRKLRFWAKTTPEGQPAISVFHHMLNVGQVALQITKAIETTLQHFKLDPETVAVLAALHDIGKISQGFQSKCPAWLEQNGLKEDSVAQRWQRIWNKIIPRSASTPCRICWINMWIGRAPCIGR